MPEQMSLRCLCLVLLALPLGCAPAGRETLVFASARSGSGDLYRLNLMGQAEALIASPAPEGGPRYDAARERLI